MTTQANEVLKNGILDQTVTFTTGKGKKAVTETMPLKDIKINDQFKKTYNVIDILQEGIAADALKTKAEVSCEYFAEHMVQLAMTCPNVEAFQGLIKTALNSLRLGRPPAGTSKDEAKLWNPTPQTVKDYTSRIVRAWNQGIEPGKEYRIDQKDSKGKVKKVKQVASSPAIMVKIATQKKASEPASPQGERAGVEVKSDGTQESHMPKLSDTDKEDLRVMAAVVAPDLMAMLSRTLELYELVDAKEKQTIINTIDNLNKRLEKKVGQAEAKAA